jgi:hypothetical protein
LPEAVNLSCIRGAPGAASATLLTAAGASRVMLKELPGVTYVGAPHLGSTIEAAIRKAADRRKEKRYLIVF